jgi:hypothetical protein
MSPVTKGRNLSSGDPIEIGADPVTKSLNVFIKGGTAGGYMQGCHIYRTTNQTIAQNNPTALLFNAQRYDTDSMHDTSVNSGRITFQTAGKYIIGACIQWAANSSGCRDMWFWLNGAISIGEDKRYPVASPNNTCLVANVVYDFAQYNYIELIVLQNTTGNLDVIASGNSTPEFWAQRIG